MPKTSHQKRTALRSRSHIHRRKNKQKQGRQGSNGNHPQAPKVIANSFFALTLKAKPGLEISDKIVEKPHRGYHSATDDYEAMYKDLLQAYQNALKLVKGEQSPCDPLKDGFELSMALHYVTCAFKNNILPEGYRFNIDRTNEGEYFFTIFKEVDFPDYWHAFELKQIVKKLWRDNQKLHDLFIVLIKSFMTSAGICGWWNGGMGYADWQLEERIANWDDSYGDFDEGSKEHKESMKAFASAVTTCKSYENGDPAEYQSLISKAKPRSADSLLKSLDRFSKRSPIVQWMIEVCEFMKLPGTIDDFTYPEMMEEHEGLHFDEQATVIWDWEDEYTAEQMEGMEATVQGCGEFPPILNMGIMPYSKKIDFDDLQKREAWPQKLSDLFKSMREVIKMITQKKKKNAKRKN